MAGRESSRMEKEAVAEIAGMFGWEAPAFLGHLCGGGTMANLEALWVAGRLHPGAAVVASSQAHYTHGRIGSVLGLPFEPIACDDCGRMDARALERRLERGGVGTVVATMGTTATGSVDPLPEILALRERHGFRLHADAAYGGYFGLADNLAPEARRAYDRLGEVDSIVIDPHKHGLQPYGCGCVLFRDPAVGRFYKHDSPVHVLQLRRAPSRRDQPRVLPARSRGRRALGDAAAPCRSRWAANSPAGWTDCRAAALDFHDALSRDARFLPAFPPSSTSSSGSRARRARRTRPPVPAGSSRRPRAGTSTSPSRSCRRSSSSSSAPGSRATARR